MKKITTIGGGSGQYALLSALRDVEGIDINAVVSMVDSGGSTGRLRDELGVLPPGDVLKCILALSPNRDIIRKILQTRFDDDGRLQGHNAGNMLLTILSQYAGSFSAGIKAFGKTLGMKGRVLPVTEDKATLVAELTDGSRLYGEAAIDIPRGNQREKIKKTFLVPHHKDSISVYPEVVKAIKNSHYIIISPGDLFTSVVPNLLVPGVKEAIQATNAKIIYVVNIMTKFGETDNFKAKDFARVVEKYMKRKVDYILVNNEKPEKEIIENYKKQKAKLVKNNIEKGWKNREVISDNFLSVSKGIIRHDAIELARAIENIIK